jgi:lipoate-protein ligase A
LSFVWRLIEEGPASGGWNMGVDEALLAVALEGCATLRLYSWEGPWLSLGYGQPGGDPIARACREAGVGLIRRATGGRAVLHGGDLTYAIAAPENALPAGLRGSYRSLAQVLLGALESVGVVAISSPGASGFETGSAPSAPGPPGRGAGFDCFEAPAEDEICLDGAKLAGSAQRRAGGAVLQHGSIRLRPDPTAAARAVGMAGTRATSLQETGHQVAEADLRRAFVESFRRVFGVAVAHDELSARERAMALARVRDHSRAPFARPQLPC